ncbi:AMP-binding protein [Kribbella deserti]|uniref:AMP-binding protein n=1 Tax=Kribbella deserti TaxID=1926257 RepID=A0ABV6QMP7_9ACTN
MTFLPLDLAAAPGRHLLRGLRPDERHLARLLVSQAEDLGDKAALRTGDTTVTYAELPRLAAAGRKRLQAAGVSPGERVVTIAGNSVHLVQLFLGCTVTGAIYVPLDPGLPADQLAERIAAVEPVAIYAENPQAGQLAIAGDEPLLADGLPEASYDGTLPGLILHTSGTTGPAKGVLCPHSQLLSWGIFGNEQLGVTSEDVLYTNLPLFHCNALVTLTQSWVAGATAVVGREFDVGLFWAQLAEYEATITFLLGSMIHQLIARSNEIPPPSDHRLRLVLAPGAGVEAKHRFTEWSDVLVVDAFGMTELNVVSYEPLDRIVSGSMGVPFPDFEIRVADRYDVPVPDGSVGQLLVRPRSPFITALGYWNAPQDTMDAWRNLWFHTGDLVAWEPDGSLRYVDRVADAIYRGGHPVSSREIEAAFHNHPAVLECAVYGVPAVGGDDILAAVRLVPGARVGADELAGFATRELPAGLVPDYVFVVDELPHTANGKIAKAVLREQGRDTLQAAVTS